MELCDVKKPTEEICLAAVKQNGEALQYVKEQTAELCMAAVQQDTKAITLIHNSEMRKKIEGAAKELQVSTMSVF